ncbi:hypothetical protein Tco_0007792 [Tanacetum coccineum]
MKPNEPTYQVALDALALTTCYPAFLVTAEVPVIYMHQFWATVTKYKASYRFKIDNKRFSVNVEVFKEILNICPKIPGKEFDETPSEKEALSFIRELGHSREIKYITDAIVDHLHQPWITFASIINKCLCGKELAYQIDNIDSKKQDKMFYLIFTKIIIHHFLEKDKSISMRNRMSMHTARDDSFLGTMRFVSRHEDSQYMETTSKKKPTKANKDVTSKKKPFSKPKPSKKKALIEADRGKGLNVLSEVALSKAAQLKEDTKQSKKYFHISQASGSGDGTDFESGVPDEKQCKTSGTDEGTGTKPEVPDVPKYLSESENESWGDSDNDKINDDNSDEVTKDDDKDDDGNDAHDSERTDSDEDDENPSFTLKDYDEEEPDEEYDSDDDNENLYEEEDDDLYKDVNVRSLGAEHEKERKGDEEMTDADQNVSQEKEQVVEDTHIHQEEFSTQEPSLFTVPDTVIPENSTTHTTTVPLTISMITPLPQLTTPSPTPTTVSTTTSIPALPDFSSLFGFDQRVSTLEQELSQFKQADHSAQLLEFVKSQISTIVDDLLSMRIGYATRTALQSNTKEFEKKAQEERKLYIDVVEKSVKDIIKDEVKCQLPHILPKEVLDFATFVIQSTINESLESIVLAKSSSQPKSTYEATTSLTEFELKKILLDKIEKSKSYQAAPEHRELYDGLVKSYNLNKDRFSSYGNLYSLKRDREDEDKDEDPPAGSNQGLKNGRQAISLKSSGKSVQVEKPKFEIADSDMPQNQEGNLGYDNEEPMRETPQQGPNQSWLMTLAATADKPSKTFDELMSTPIDFYAYIMNSLKIANLSQETLLGPAFKLLKGTRTNFAELEYEFEECYKALSEKLDWDNPEGGDYPFDLTKPLPLVMNGNRQIVLVNHFFNNDLKYLQGGILTMTYTTSTTKTKATQYDLPGIKDMAPNIWSPAKVAYDKHAI